MHLDNRIANSGNNIMIRKLDSDARMMSVSVTIVHMADSKEALDKDTEALLSVASGYMCKYEKLKYQQLQGLKTVLPLGAIRTPNTLRTLTSVGASMLTPFRAETMSHSTGVYFGRNKVTKGLIFIDRTLLMNGNGFYLGTSGSGKSFFAKDEIASLILRNMADVLILDPEREWVSVIVIAVIAVVALLVCSAFGIFAHEDLTGCKPMSEIVAEISSEYHERMEADALAVDIGSYDALAISYMGDGDGDAPVNNWNDVIAVFAVYCSTNPDDAMDVIELTDISIDYIRRIFYEMNWYELSTDGRYDEEEEMWVLTVYVKQHSMNYREAADHFEFTDYQREILYEMMKPEYCSYYARLMGISVSGDANVNDMICY